MMRNARAFGFGRFCRSDIHPAIDLHRVNADDFSSRCFSQLDGYGRFADACLSGKEDRVDHLACVGAPGSSAPCLAAFQVL